MLFLNFRSGVFVADELESDFKDDVDFLMAKLKRAQDEKVGRVAVVGMYADLTTNTIQLVIELDPPLCLIVLCTKRRV